MRRFLIFACLFVTSLAAASDLIQEMAKRSEVTYTNVPREVLAFYYPWYGTPEFDGGWHHWGTPDFEKKDIPQSLNYPVLGPYSSHDPKVVHEHMRMMKQAGVTGVIVSWWGVRDFSDRAMPLILDECARQRMTATIYYESVPRPQNPQTAIKDFNYVLSQYADHGAFLKVGKKPVIVVYGRAMGQLSLEQWAEVIAETKVVAIADGYSVGNALVFDGVHTYNPAPIYTNKSLDEIRATARKTSQEWVKLAREHRKISVVTILPGYDDTKIRKPGLKLDRFDGKLYDIVCEEAVAADPDWIFITSFNELHEGSELEPTLELGDLYLHKTASHAKPFLAKPPAKVPPAGELDRGKVSSAQWRALARSYRGARIGVFGGISTSAIRLRQLGFNVEFLRWEDIADAEVLTVKNYPLLYFSGTEQYVRTAPNGADVIASLRRYLSDGGAMLVVPQMPFPFFYDESGRARGAAGELGLPILGPGARVAGEGPARHVGGFESPPEGVKLTFQVNTRALPHLPPSLPFPDWGDQRFRPVHNLGLSKGDTYVPLFRAVGENGEWHGDGGAYIEHKLSEPRRARLVYLWFRIPDLAPLTDLFFDLLTFLRSGP